ERFLIEPQVVRFMESRIDAVTRRAVKVEAHMNAVFVAHVYNAGYLFDGRLLYLVYFFRCDLFTVVDVEVRGISHRYPHEIKSPIPHPLYMIFAGGSSG